MPQKPRRRLTRRTAPPRPTYPGAAAPAEASAGGGSAATPVAEPASTSTASLRAQENVARQMPLLRGEMRRVGWVSLVCFGLLVALTVVDRFQ